MLGRTISKRVSGKTKLVGQTEDKEQTEVKGQAEDKAEDKDKRAVYQDREIDIDLLLYDRLVLNEPDLVLPHPLMHKRKFVLLPLSQIAPELQHPVLERSVQELLSALD
jgi:7,8-dihydro-6-hydroxymethylpterin-pyrophosphokinase